MVCFALLAEILQTAHDPYTDAREEWNRRPRCCSTSHDDPAAICNVYNAKPWALKPQP